MNWNLTDEQPAPYPKKDSELALKREIWQTTKKAVAYYFLVSGLLALIALLGVIHIWFGMARDVSAFNAQVAQVQAEHPALPMANWNPQH